MYCARAGAVWKCVAISTSDDAVERRAWSEVRFMVDTSERVRLGGVIDPGNGFAGGGKGRPIESTTGGARVATAKMGEKEEGPGI
jgi:hypothetical protein